MHETPSKKLPNPANIGSSQHTPSNMRSSQFEKRRELRKHRKLTNPSNISSSQHRAYLSNIGSSQHRLTNPSSIGSSYLRSLGSKIGHLLAT